MPRRVARWAGFSHWLMLCRNPTTSPNRIGHTLGKSSAADSDAPMPARIETKFRTLSRYAVEAVAALEALHRSDEPVSEERALDLELVERLGVGAPVDLGESALHQSRQILRLAAQLGAHAERLEQRVDLVVALAHEAGDDALAAPRLGCPRHPGLDLIGHVLAPSSCVPAPPRQTVVGLNRRGWDSSCTRGVRAPARRAPGASPGWARADRLPQSGPPAPVGGRLQACQPRHLQKLLKDVQQPGQLARGQPGIQQVRHPAQQVAEQLTCPGDSGDVEHHLVQVHMQPE